MLAARLILAPGLIDADQELPVLIDLPRDLESICLKSLAKNPDRRYATAEALAEDLARFLRREPTEARPLRWPARAARPLQPGEEPAADQA